MSDDIVFVESFVDETRHHISSIILLYAFSTAALDNSGGSDI